MFKHSYEEIFDLAATEPRERHLALLSCQLLVSFAHDCKTIILNNTYQANQDEEFGTLNGKIGDSYRKKVLDALVILFAGLKVDPPYEDVARQARDEEIERLTSKYGDYERQIGRYRETINNRDAQIGRLHDNVHSVSETLQAALQQITEMECTHAERRGMLKLFGQQLHETLRDTLRDVSDIPF